MKKSWFPAALPSIGIILVLLAGLGAYWLQQPVLRYTVLEPLFWYTALLFFLCMCLVGFAYQKRGGETRRMRFSYGILLIIAAVMMDGSCAVIAHNIDTWRSSFDASYLTFILLLKQGVEYEKGIVTFGFAALGASLAASAIVEGKTLTESTVKPEPKSTITPVKKTAAKVVKKTAAKPIAAKPVAKR